MHGIQQLHWSEPTSLFWARGKHTHGKHPNKHQWWKIVRGKNKWKHPVGYTERIMSCSLSSHLPGSSFPHMWKTRHLMIRNCTCKLGLQGLSPIFSASCSKMYLCFASVAAGVYLLRECYLAFNSCSKSSVCRSNLACISPSPIIPLSPLNHITPIVINYTHNESHDMHSHYIISWK